MTERVPQAINGEFVLCERAGCSGAPWRSLKLVRDPREAGEKNKGCLGCNDTRLARNTGAIRARTAQMVGC
jgi:hypothetical protein